MSDNNVNMFVDGDDEAGDVANAQGNAAHQSSMQDFSAMARENRGTIHTSAIENMDAHLDALPNNTHRRQINPNATPEHRRIFVNQQGGPNDPNAYDRVLISEEQFGNRTIGLKSAHIIQSPTLSSRDNSTIKNSPVTEHAHYQSFQQGQCRGNNRGLLPPCSPMGIRSRSARGGLQLSMNEPGMGGSVCYENRSNGNENMFYHNRHGPTPMRKPSHEQAEASYARGVGSNFTDSPFSTSIPDYNSNGAFRFGSCLGSSYGNSMGMGSNFENPHGNLKFQSAGTGFHEYDGTPSFRYNDGQDMRLRDPDTDARSEEDVDDFSGSLVSSRTGEDLESVLLDNHPLRTETRARRTPVQNINRFKGHFDRATHRVGIPLQRLGKPLTKKSKGASDPVNTQIVDLYDNHNWSFAAIAQELNSKQEEKGIAGTFTANSVHNRYNRSAPVIYKADGRKFISIKDRRHHTQEELDSLDSGANSTMWNEHMDKILVNIVTKYDANKWKNVASTFNSTTGQNLNPSTVSARFGLLTK